jgi:hypothetical protein
MSTNSNQSELIVNFIDAGIKKMVAERYEILKKDFLKQLERDKATELAGISLYIMKQISIDTLGDTTTIVLRTEKR